MKAILLKISIGLLVLAGSGDIASGGTEIGVTIGLRGRVHGNLHVITPQAGHQHFHDALKPYGYWIEHPVHGRVWQPAAVAADPTWRPYCNDGQWVWTDRGWYWQSNYVWGWAPFHYGRWLYTQHHHWVWLPGTEWAPAWVHWRSAHNHTYGWAPLPPGCDYTAGIGFHYPGSRLSFRFGVELSDHHYVFVSYNNFFSGNIGSVVYSRPQCSTYYRSSSCCDHGYRHSGQAIYHAGPSVRLSQHAGSRSATINRVVQHQLQRSPKPVRRPSSSYPYGHGLPSVTYVPPARKPAYVPHHPYSRTYSQPPSRTYRRPSGSYHSSSSRTYKKPPSRSHPTPSRTYKAPPSTSRPAPSRTYKAPPSGSRSTPTQRSSSRSSSSSSGGSRSSRINSRIRSRR